jgi:molecular chaperone DnaK
MANDNKTLGRFILDGIPPAPRGVPQVEVTFDIDANGILSVGAKDKASGKTQSIRIEAQSGLSKDEIERMKKDAEVHADEDRKKKEQIEIKNTAESLIYTTEKTMRDSGDKIPADTKKTLEDQITELKKELAGANAEAIKKATDTLSASLSKAGEAMYKSAGTPDASASSEKKDTATDVEHEDLGNNDATTK